MSPIESQRGVSLARLLPGKWLPAGVDDVVVGGICMDHRRLRAGDVFIAIAGNRFDGRRFIAEAIRAGAAAILKQADSVEQVIGWQANVPVIPIVDLAREAGAIAGRFYGEPSSALAVIGVTGTNGKTTTTHLLAQLHRGLGENAGVVGTLGYGLVADNSHYFEHLTETGMTTADGITTQAVLAALRDDGARVAAMEVSSHSLVQHRVGAVNFSAAVFSNLTQDHLDYHGDMDNYGAAKRMLFDFASLRQRIVNIDDDFGRQLAQAYAGQNLFTYALHDKAADVHVRDFSLTEQGVAATVISPWGDGQLRSRLFGEFNLYNLLAALTTCCARGYPLDAVLAATEKLVPIPGRMEPVNDGTGPRVVVDYAHTPDSLERALSALRRHAKGRLICVFGCGGDRDRGKRPLMAAVAERLADRVIVTNDNPRSEAPEAIFNDIRAGFASALTVKVIADRAKAIARAVEEAAIDDCILIAGKGHETYQQIGNDRLPFSDVKQARLALRARHQTGGAKS